MKGSALGHLVLGVRKLVEPISPSSGLKFLGLLDVAFGQTPVLSDTSWLVGFIQGHLQFPRLPRDLKGS